MALATPQIELLPQALSKQRRQPLHLELSAMPSAPLVLPGRAPATEDKSRKDASEDEEEGEEEETVDDGEADAIQPKAPTTKLSLSEATEAILTKMANKKKAVKCDKTVGKKKGKGKSKTSKKHHKVKLSPLANSPKTPKKAGKTPEKLKAGKTPEKLKAGKTLEKLKVGKTPEKLKAGKTSKMMPSVSVEASREQALFRSGRVGPGNSKVFKFKDHGGRHGAVRMAEKCVVAEKKLRVLV